VSEVDRLRNVGLSPVLPIADRRGSKQDSSHSSHDNARTPSDPTPKPPGSADAGTPPHPPKSLIDDYA
jgi:hypothetical protein